MRKRIGMLLMAVALFLSLLGNGFQFVISRFESVYTGNSNSRDTYFSVHNIKQAHHIAKGAGIKVGVLDTSFSLSDSQRLFSGGEDFASSKKSLYNDLGHGWQMAATLREIAPECDIYALNISMDNESKKVDSIIAAIEWAIENELDILTLSQAQISDENRARLDSAVNMAVENGIVTTFIHYDNPVNLLPYSTTPYYEGEYAREPDVNVYHYDYNTIRPSQIRAFEKRETPPDSGNDMPYFSYSSMSPVTAGFVAILKSINNTLTPREYKQILIDTSYSMDYAGVMEWENGRSEHTVDISKAASKMQSIL